MEEQTAGEMPAGTAEQQAAGSAEPQPATMDEALGEEGQLIDEIERSLGAEAGDGQPVARMQLEQLAGDERGAETMRDLDLLADVEVEVAVEFGRTRLPLRRLLTLRRGSLVELARRPEQQVTVLANGTPIAFGDIVVVGDQIGVHIVELVDPKDPAPPPPDEPTMVDLHEAGAEAGSAAPTGDEAGMPDAPAPDPGEADA